MAGKKGRFTVNTGRIDPYKNFRFRVAIGAALSALAGILMMKKLRPRGSQGDAADYITPGHSNDPPRPINSVGTSTAGRARRRKRATAKKPGQRKAPKRKS